MRARELAPQQRSGVLGEGSEPAARWTGVDWAARPVERLSADLLGSNGSGPLRAAAHEYGRLAGAYATAAVDLDRALGRLDAAVRLHRGESRSGAVGATSSDGLREYARWLARHGAELAEYAAALSAQAASYEAAALAMPGSGELTALRAERTLAERSVLADGGVLAGRLARLETAERDSHLRAVAVMEGYEDAARGTARPHRFTAPPRAASGTRDKRSRTGGPASGGRASGGAGGTAGGVGTSAIPAAPLPGYQAAALIRDEPPARSVAVPQQGTSQPLGRGMPLAPAMLGAAG
ncbi:PPE domain-containing protein, partial [Tsukamurella soli]